MFNWSRYSTDLNCVDGEFLCTVAKGVWVQQVVVRVYKLKCCVFGDPLRVFMHKEGVPCVKSVPLFSKVILGLECGMKPINEGSNEDLILKTSNNKN